MMRNKSLDKKAQFFNEEDSNNNYFSSVLMEKILWQLKDVKLIKLIERIVVIGGIITLVGMAYYQWVEDSINYYELYGGFSCGRTITTNELGYFVVFWASFIGLLFLLGNIKK